MLPSLTKLGFYAIELRGALSAPVSRRGGGEAGGSTEATIA